MSWISEILKNLRYRLFFDEKARRQPVQKIELIVEVSFEAFVQICFTDASGKYRIRTFNGKKWSTEILLYEEREVMFSVFVNNDLQKKDQNIVMIRKVNDEITARQKIDLSHTLLYEGWFKLE
jgi:endoglucanase Acf2